MRVFVAGYKGKGFGGRAITWFTFGEYSHVSLVFENSGSLIEIESIQGKGVHAQPFDAGGECDLFEVQATPGQIERIHAAAAELVGRKYDWTGIWGFMRRRKRENPKKWFCSELVAHCLLRAGIEIQRMPPWKQSPVIVCASTVLKPQ